jgi:uncharacterized membrane protein SpoIIM required for sporulation
MKQELFQARHQDEWDALERWLVARTRPRRRERARDVEGLLGDDDFPAAYRRACQHLALAERRAYSEVLVARLRDLVQRGHLALYRPNPPRWQRVVTFFGAEFPRLVRRERGAMAVAALLLFGPMLAMIFGLVAWPEYAHVLFDPEQLAEYEAMFDPAADSDRLGRESGTDLYMFGVYVMNNVSIGFRTFASGLLAGVGPVLVLLLNGVLIGGVAGHLTAVGHGEPFWRFVVGHSAPELLAIVIAGGAGLQLGMALISPGRRTRGRALVEAGTAGARLVLGAFAMLVFAAFVEAYWSSLAQVPDPVRYGVGGLLWLAIGLWLWRGGRGGVEPDASEAGP